MGSGGKGGGGAGRTAGRGRGTPEGRGPGGSRAALALLSDAPRPGRRRGPLRAGRPPGPGSRGAGATASFSPSSSGSPGGHSGRERGQPGSRAPEGQARDPDAKRRRRLPPAGSRRRRASAGRDPCAAASRSALFRKEIKPLKGARPPRLLSGPVRSGEESHPGEGGMEPRGAPRQRGRTHGRNPELRWKEESREEWRERDGGAETD